VTQVAESTSSGRFVVLEGVEGAGKTTQARMLSEWLEAEGIAHTLAREPGGTAVGEAIRNVVQDRPELDVPRETELLLYVAARAAFVRQIVRPALERGELVIADRFSWSTFAYQGYGRGLELEAVRAVNAFGTGGLQPAVYLIFDLEVGLGRARQAASGQPDDRIEQAGDEFLERVRAGYHEMAAAEPRAHLIDAGGSPEEVFGRMKDVLMQALPETFGGNRVFMDDDSSPGGGVI
jgi:dTMP kinase